MMPRQFFSPMGITGFFIMKIKCRSYYHRGSGEIFISKRLETFSIWNVWNSLASLHLIIFLCTYILYYNFDKVCSIMNELITFAIITMLSLLLISEFLTTFLVHIIVFFSQWRTSRSVSTWELVFFHEQKAFKTMNTAIFTGH